MRPNTLPLLCHPLTHEPLRVVVRPDPDGNSQEKLVSIKTGEEFPIRDGIPIFLREADVSGSNKKYQELYNHIAPFYDLSMQVSALLKSGGEGKRRTEYLQQLEIKAGDRVLEVSVGTGGNLRYLPRTAKYFGLDLSWGMLKRCQKNLKARGMEAELFLGAAEYLPFDDGAFDVVFHMGGINFFSDKARAIQEMIRVAKPGTKLMIVDENEQVAKKLEKAPLAGKFYGNRTEMIATPVDLVPVGMQEIKVRDVCNGDLYCLTFRKPLAESTRRWESALAQQPAWHSTPALQGFGVI
jgi:ubiquinone/menaquinone biosynthesis C-methylase UbiE